jgi:hypothetical protein
MVDYFTIALTHALLGLAALRLVLRDDLDADPPCEPDEAETPETQSYA